MPGIGTICSICEINYGHNKGDKIMFGGLKQYRNADYMKQHRYIYIYTPDTQRTYKVFAAVTYDGCLITERYPNGDLEKQQTFLDSLSQARDSDSIVMDDIEVTAKSRIITLSTCISSKMKNYRFIVVGVLVDEQK
jgi:sortase B